MEKAAKMQPMLALLLILIISPLGILLLHIAIHRLSLRLKLALSGQATALISILIGNLLVLYLVWHFTLSYWAGNPLSLVCGLLYTLVVYNVLGILYFDALNISETSLHMHILLEIAWAGKLSQAGLQEKYSAENMIKARLERMTALGQIQLKDDRYYLTNRSILYLSRLFTIWRSILGLPLEPHPAEPSLRHSVTNEA